GVNPIPDLCKSSNDYPVIVRGVELQEAIEKLFQIFFGVNLLLQDHLQHGVAEIEIWVVGIFLHGHALAADPTEALNGFGFGVGGGGPRGFEDGGEGGGGGGGAGGGGGCSMGGSVYFWAEDGGDFGPLAVSDAA
ncbi:hypothetical protein F511_09568, partial [Dorcoceras hygrometricum]